MNELLNDIKDFLSSFAEMEAEQAKAEADILNNRLAECFEQLDSGVLEIHEKKTYWFIWNDGSFNEAQGNGVADAFTTLGYGGGAMAALDYYDRPRTGSNCINSGILIPIKGEARARVLAYYKEEIHRYLGDLKANNKDMYVSEVRRFHEVVQERATRFGDASAAPFREMLAELMGDGETFNLHFTKLEG